MRLVDWVEAPRRVRTLAARAPDPRLSAPIWAALLQRELNALFTWALDRVGRPSAGLRTFTRYQRVVSLLPRYGGALHVIRRVLPFAILGHTTEYVVHPRMDRQDVASAAMMITALGLASRVGRQPPHASAWRLRPDEPTVVVVTGRPRTLQRVSAQTPAVVLGATGACSVVAGTDPEVVASCYRRLGHAVPLNSCTRPGAGLVCVRTGRGVAVQTLGGDRIDWPTWLRLMHPSVILTPDRVLPIASGGYTVLRCDAQGVTDTVAGLGRDPVYGWPGDYLF